MGEVASAASRWGRSCRTRLCGWCSAVSVHCVPLVPMFQCRTRLCGWCSTSDYVHPTDFDEVSMPHAALWVVQQNGTRRSECRRVVSMPHAALWVVQRSFPDIVCVPHGCFNAARGFVGGAAGFSHTLPIQIYGFQCRTRLCGWCSWFV